MTAHATADDRFDPAAFIGLFMITLGLFLGVSIYSANIAIDVPTAAGSCWTGLFGVYAAYYVRLTVGTLPAYALSGLLVLWGVHVVRKQRFWNTWPQVAGGLLMVSALSVLVTSATSVEMDPRLGGLLGLDMALKGGRFLGPAGVFGAGLLVLISGAFLAFGRYVIIFCRSCLVVAETLAQGFAWVMVKLQEKAVALNLGERWQSWRVRRAEASAARKEARELRRAEAEAVRAQQAAAVEDDFEDVDSETGVAVMDGESSIMAGVSDEIPITIKEEPKKRSRRSRRKAEKSAKKGRILARRSDQEYVLPSLDLLEPPEQEVAEHRETLKKRADILEKTLSEFKIEGKVVGIESGPWVTMFEMSLAPGIRVERIFSLANNITMALKAYNVRIVAPIPGKDTVGIEIPNMNDKVVGMREIAEEYDFKGNKMAAPMFLGGDITGSALISDLARMPHLLIAGATGSGKSVCINTILLSFLIAKRPDELKLILVDPKMVELSRFKKVPHLMCPVVTDMKRAASILEWACSLMDQRYEQMAMLGVNNIVKFNDLGEKAILQRLDGELPAEEIETFPKKMPYIVIVIDELADLMLVAGKDVEKSIIRLASKSRAVGIHVILATQRPSVDVITGLIKANMPSRIAFQVASKVDSRTILDANGAETLLGSGDMLYLPPASNKLIRSQGVYVTDKELFAVVDHCADQAEPEFHEELKGLVIGGASKAEVEDRDELFDQCVRAIIESGRGSVSLLQRKFGIGYGRASRIVDQVAAAGVLGPFREGKAREILLTLEDYEAMIAGQEQGAKIKPVGSANGAYENGGQDDDSEEYESYYDDDSVGVGVRPDENPRDNMPWDD